MPNQVSSLKDHLDRLGISSLVCTMATLGILVDGVSLRSLNMDIDVNTVTYTLLGQNKQNIHICFEAFIISIPLFLKKNYKINTRTAVNNYVSMILYIHTNDS